ncbi:MAG: hypothetical protein HYV95_14580 [Opitutae bacterium]|nr:hypothetical protein [Opitutae bacterium]
MSLAELKHEAERLSPAERRHLAAHLAALERKSDPGFKRHLADKINDKTPGRWVVLEDAEKRLRK